MLDVELLGELKLFAEDHPFVEVHFIGFKGVVTEHSFGFVALLAKFVKCHAEVLILEDLAGVCLFEFLFGLEHVRTS